MIWDLYNSSTEKRLKIWFPVWEALGLEWFKFTDLLLVENIKIFQQLNDILWEDTEME